MNGRIEMDYSVALAIEKGSNKTPTQGENYWKGPKKIEHLFLSPWESPKRAHLYMTKTMADWSELKNDFQ